MKVISCPITKEEYVSQLLLLFIINIPPKENPADNASKFPNKDPPENFPKKNNRIPTNAPLRAMVSLRCGLRLYNKNK